MSEEAGKHKYVNSCVPQKPTPKDCRWSPLAGPDGVKHSGFTKQTAFMQSKLSALYKTVGRGSEARMLLKQYRRGLQCMLPPSLSRRYGEFVGGAGLTILGISNNASNCLYASAVQMRGDLMALFSQDIGFARDHCTKELQHSLVVVRDLVTEELKLNDTVQDDGVVLPQCQKHQHCRRPDRHKQKCLRTWVGNCRRHDFASRMIPEETVRDVGPRIAAAMHCSRVVALVRMYRTYKFTPAALQSLCDRLARNKREVQWCDNLIRAEKQCSQGRVSVVEFLATVSDCATCPGVLEPK